MPNSLPTNDPEASGPGNESVPQVFDRVTDTMRDLGALAERGPMTSLRDDVEVKVASGDGMIELTIIEGRLTRLALDHTWLAEEDPYEIERALMSAVNEGWQRFQAAALEQLKSADVGIGTVLEQMSRLQVDLHRAYQHDLDSAEQKHRRGR